MSIMLCQFIGDAGVVGVGPYDGGGLFYSYNAVNAVFIEITSLDDPFLVFFVQSVEVNVVDHHLLDRIVCLSVLRLKIFG